MVSSIVTIVLYVVFVIGLWRMFQKAGEKAALVKAIIPIVNEYFMFKVGWKTKKFWLLLILEVVEIILLIAALTMGVIAVGGLLGSSTGMGVGLGAGAMVLIIIAVIIGIITVIMMLRMYYKFVKSYGHGIGFTILMLILPWLATLIMGFGGSQYEGPRD